MARRLPSQPPNLPGFSYVRALGSGGFADVFLYEQNMPRRQVAVKVMLSAIVNDQVRQMFQAEANLMAQLSAHPSILTVYQASVSSDGRPYLVMELCSASLSSRYRSERIPVADVLRIAVKIGSAIETAHRAGVLHRDLKPSNILMTAYGHPVLSDFGIASTLAEANSQESIGMSIPWSAPEVLMDETAGSIPSEVWGLAATVYSLLAGRSPFEVPGGANAPADLISRINRAKPQPIDRDDVPPALEKLLQRAMSRRPDDRPSTALELVRELQAVETAQGLPQTAVEVAMDEWALATLVDLDDRTRVRGAAAAPSVGLGQGSRRRRRSAATSAVGTVRDSKSGRRTTDSRLSVASQGTKLLVGVLIGCAVVVIAVGAAAALVFLRQGRDVIPVVSDITATTSGSSVTFSWKDPGLTEDELYQIVPSDGSKPSAQTASTFVVDADLGDRSCITVVVIRDGKQGRPSAEKCADVAG